MKNLKGTDLAIDITTQDLELVDGDLSLVEGLDAISQSIKQRLQFFLGEWFLSTNDGVPWFQSIFVKSTNLLLVEAILRDRVLATPGILELNSFNFDYDNITRKLSVRFNATTINGDLNFSELIGAA